MTGGAGFLGARITELLLRRADEGRAPLDFGEIVSLDLAPSPVRDPRVRSLVGDLSDPALLREAVTAETAGIFHLAAVLSGGSEEDFDLAARVNLDATRALLEAARAAGNRPRLVFTSSLAVFGGGAPETVPEDWAARPESGYGALKAIGELLVNEYSRRGFVDGRACRLPTIAVRPGRPNSAASSFLSGIIREPLAGLPATLPVPEDTRAWLCSPDTAAENLVRALLVPGEGLGAWRVLTLPGITVTVAEMLEALERAAGPAARALVSAAPDPRVAEIVGSWPGAFDASRALALGFSADSGIDGIIAQYRAREAAGS